MRLAVIRHVKSASRGVGIHDCDFDHFRSPRQVISGLGQPLNCPQIPAVKHNGVPLLNLFARGSRNSHKPRILWTVAGQWFLSTEKSGSWASALQMSIIDYDDFVRA